MLHLSQRSEKAVRWPSRTAYWGWNGGLPLPEDNFNGVPARDLLLLSALLRSLSRRGEAVGGTHE
ncbi:hypothetical protein HFN20_26770 [Paenibacillus dendritiformis]|uniref:hypothetical protein n=1 Tax=Paenibacillus dendritiformis TaxID=130049 RepID=UPI00143D4A8C|nr:hypothetical protein [Paenibacillus dendritiformis]NKI24756.1 hypothetical protein [Paenibacillus dendritiformis]NRF99193.1 hypothetical protein [Paenibacillus dendritiformis]